MKKSTLKVKSVQKNQIQAEKGNFFSLWEKSSLFLLGTE